MVNFLILNVRFIFIYNLFIAFKLHNTSDITWQYVQNITVLQFIVFYRYKFALPCKFFQIDLHGHKFYIDVMF